MENSPSATPFFLRTIPALLIGYKIRVNAPKYNENYERKVNQNEK